VIQQLKPYQELAAAIKFGTVGETTFYARHGDWFAWSCLVIGISLAGLKLRHTGVDG
jgi:apolipoprotein N-acyltransferase